MTIYALSSGPGLSGIAVIRISGNETKEVLLNMTKGSMPLPRVASLKKILEREKRLELYEDTIKFINTRVKLDYASFKEDIWSH